MAPPGVEKSLQPLARLELAGWLICRELGKVRKVRKVVAWRGTTGMMKMLFDLRRRPPPEVRLLGCAISSPRRGCVDRKNDDDVVLLEAERVRLIPAGSCARLVGFAPQLGRFLTQKTTSYKDLSAICPMASPWREEDLSQGGAWVVIQFCR